MRNVTIEEGREGVQLSLRKPLLRQADPEESARQTGNAQLVVVHQPIKLLASTVHLPVLSEIIERSKSFKKRKYQKKVRNVFFIFLFFIFHLLTSFFIATIIVPTPSIFVFFPIIELKDENQVVSGAYMIPYAFTTEASTYLQLLSESDFPFPTQRPIICGGPDVREPRDVVYFGDENVPPLKYSTISRTPHPWPPVLLKIRERIQKVVNEILPMLPCQPPNATLNALLLNRYNTGEDAMGKHRDITPCLGKEPFIASVSFGAAREFRFRHFSLQEEQEKKKRSKANRGKGRQARSTPGTKTTYKSVILTSGSLLLMIGSRLQENYQHLLVRDKSITEARYTLNFRHHEPKEQ